MSGTQDEIEYTPEQIAEARRLVEYDNAKTAADLAARSAAYRAATAAIVASLEWASVRDGLAAIGRDAEAGGVLSIHVDAMIDIMGRLDKALPANTGG